MTWTVAAHAQIDLRPVMPRHGWLARARRLLRLRQGNWCDSWVIVRVGQVGDDAVDDIDVRSVGTARSFTVFAREPFTLSSKLAFPAANRRNEPDDSHR